MGVFVYVFVRCVSVCLSVSWFFCGSCFAVCVCVCVCVLLRRPFAGLKGKHKEGQHFGVPL